MYKPFRKLLIANRGEIACRVARTADRLGVKTVGVYNEADKAALHVDKVTESLFIPNREGEPVCYSNIDSLINACKRSGAEAVHPGYGFLSENKLFAEACLANDIVFIGPKTSSLEDMGSKSRAKEIMEKAGVPLIRGYHGRDQDAKVLYDAAEHIGFPLLIKAAMGGGGRGMIRVDSIQEFSKALDNVKRTSEELYQNTTVILEKFVTDPRHIEVQVFGDSFGNHVHFYERDCSVQRRHQKVIEESPSFLGEEETARLCADAINAAKAVDYVGAGTVEFIYDAAAREFYFMEMNTRLQVEHPVSEELTSQDLVEWQLKVAMGEKLPPQETIKPSGHVIELRVCAENPLQNFAGSPEKLEVYRAPPNARIDTGVYEGFTIPAEFDSMIAKIIVKGEDRSQAIQRALDAARQFHIVGPHTNLDYIRSILRSQEFADRSFSTNHLDEGKFQYNADSTSDEHKALLAALSVRPPQTASPNPWEKLQQFRVTQDYVERVKFVEEESVFDEEIVYKVTNKGNGLYSVVKKDGNDRKEFEFTINEDQVTIGGIRKGYKFYKYNGNLYLDIDDRFLTAELSPIDYGAADTNPYEISTSKIGKINALYVKKGDKVERGSRLFNIFYMKQDFTIAAEVDGIVDEINIPEELSSYGVDVPKGVIIKLRPLE